MFIECIKNNGIDYLRLSSSRRVPNKDGVKVAKKKVILNLGPLSRFDDGKPDYLARLRESFRQGVPLIDELLPYATKEQPPEQYTLTFTADTMDCVGHPKHYAQTLLDRIFSELGLAQFFTTYKAKTRIQYDLLGLVRLAVFSRILAPDSKYATFFQNDDYYEPITTCPSPDHMYDMLDVLAQNQPKILRRMNTQITKQIDRNTEVIFYDVTNFFFEIEQPDEDQEEDGEVRKGLRKNGVCKEGRKQPIVQMGLFMDQHGLPLSLAMFPGNTLDQATLRPALKDTIDDLGFPRFILIADRGLFSYKNVLHLKDQGNGYIVSKSIKKSTKEERQWILNPEGYEIVNETFRYKTRTVTKTVKNEWGESHTIQEKVVVYWSKSFYDREYQQHQSFLAFLAELKANPASFRATAAQKKSLRKFLKKEVTNKDTGEIMDSGKLLTQLDEAKIEAFTAFMGYYQIVTSELDMDPRDVIDRYHGLTRIEEQFYVMKGDLHTRPIYVRTPSHIQAHLLICFIALLILRVIQKRIVDSGLVALPKGQLWTGGLSAERTIAALRKWQVDTLPESYYRFNHLDDPDLQLILDAFGIEIPKKLFTVGELKQIKSSISVFS